jgi:hypothetical protein
MRFTLAAAAALISLVATASAAPDHAARAAIDVPPATSRQACTAHSHLLAHAAYRPGAGDLAMRCGQLLSTDTLLTVRRWDRT